MKHLFFSFLLTYPALIFAQNNCLSTEYTEGQATYYEGLPQGVGNCTFVSDSVVPDYAALATGMYNGTNGEAPAVFCGACVEVTGPIGTKIIQIVDQCPTCSHSEQDLDLSPEVFQEIIGPLTLGIGDISWHEVPCPRQQPLYIHLPGSNRWYGKVIVAGHTNRIARVEVEDGADNWVDMVRGEDNGWTKQLNGHDSYNLRITDIFGEVITMMHIDFDLTDATIIGQDNFTPCTITSNDASHIPEPIALYPNPANDVVYFEGLQHLSEMAIYNQYGMLIKSVSKMEMDSKYVDISDLPNGLYLIRFKQENHVLSSIPLSVE